MYVYSKTLQMKCQKLMGTRIAQFMLATLCVGESESESQLCMCVCSNTINVCMCMYIGFYIFTCAQLVKKCGDKCCCEYIFRLARLVVCVCVLYRWGCHRKAIESPGVPLHVVVTSGENIRFNPLGL